MTNEDVVGCVEHTLRVSRAIEELVADEKMATDAMKLCVSASASHLSDKLAELSGFLRRSSAGSS